MKIADFSLAMQSSHIRMQQSSVKENLGIWVNPTVSTKLPALATEQVTLFDIKTTTNQLLGAVQSSGVILNEDGTVGNMQQIDLMI